MKKKKQWKLHLIHHSHVDIGYTDRPEKTEAIQVDSIWQVLEALAAVRDGSRPDWTGFRWTCECFRPVEQFWKQAGPADREAFTRAVRDGHIEVCANYLHLTELARAPLFGFFIDRAMNWARNAGVRFETAMMVDVNGFRSSWARSLAEQGVQNLLAFVHSYRGLHPCWQKQRPFWWELSQGQRLLVWNGDHYQLGNEFGLLPGAFMSWTLAGDGFNGPRDPGDQGFNPARVRRYLADLEAGGFPLDILPVGIHGLASDNAPPAPDLAARIRGWNDRHADIATLNLSTPGMFFQELRARKSGDFPVYRGDWPDWWSDGVASTPGATRLFLDAQRVWERLRILDPGLQVVDAGNMAQAAERLILYAEHSWGMHDSVTEPFSRLVDRGTARKISCATEADRLVQGEMDAWLAHQGWPRHRGAAPSSTPGPRLFRVEVPECRQLPENPFGYAHGLGHRVGNESAQPVLFELETNEIPSVHETFALEDTFTGHHHAMQPWKGGRINTWLALIDPHSSTTVFKLCSIPLNQAAAVPSGPEFLGGVDRVKDILPPEGLHRSDPLWCTGSDLRFNGNRLGNGLVEIHWEPGKGIVSWYDCAAKRELVDPARDIGAFTLVHEHTPAGTGLDLAVVRRSMGRNRKGPDVRRSRSQLVAGRLADSGPIACTVELDYSLPACGSCSLLLTMYSGLARVDVQVRILKNPVLEPENLFVALPFGPGPEDVLHISKDGIPVRPWHDQLPGSLTDYCTVDGGYAVSGSGGRLAVVMPDTPLLQLGSLEYGPRLLSGHPGLAARNPETWAWLATNHWETNFKATLEGLHSYRFMVVPGAGLEHCHCASSGVMVQRAHRSKA
jgi:hypothetical protein